MKRHYLLICLTCLLSGVLLIGIVSAQATLVPNVPKTYEHLSFGSERYVCDLDAGHWTVVVTSSSFFDMEVKITVSWDWAGSDIIAVSGNGTGNFPRIAFTLESNASVYIKVEDNSVYGDSAGFFDIGVYDDSHVPGFLASLDIFDWTIIFIVVLAVFTIGCGIFSCRRAKRGVRDIQESFTVEAPMHAIPDEYKGSVQYHGSQTTTVRLPLKCPSCGAEVSHESVDWVGPLEAKCDYCGGTMRATFERI
jgi:hypothetical protein